MLDVLTSGGLFHSPSTKDRKMAKYQGHKNYNHWNVSLYLFNEYPLYKMMCREVRIARNRDHAARAILKQLPSHTPDGVEYTFTTVRAALTHWEA